MAQVESQLEKDKLMIIFVVARRSKNHDLASAAIYILPDLDPARKYKNRVISHTELFQILPDIKPVGLVHCQDADGDKEKWNGLLMISSIDVNQKYRRRKYGTWLFYNLLRVLQKESNKEITKFAGDFRKKARCFWSSLGVVSESDGILTVKPSVIDFVVNNNHDTK